MNANGLGCAKPDNLLGMAIMIERAMDAIESHERAIRDPLFGLREEKQDNYPVGPDLISRYQEIGVRLTRHASSLQEVLAAVSGECEKNAPSKASAIGR